MAITRDLVTVTGPDARSYLHGQLSQRVDDMTAREERWTFALEPTGKIVALALLRCVDDATFELETDAGYGDLLAERLNRFRIRVDAEITSAAVQHDGDAVEAERARVAAGWPAMGSEIAPGETIPAETAIAAAAVDFKKGCYPGQELVERMAARGATPPRQLRILTVGRDVPADAKPGDDVAEAASGDPIGTVTSVAGGSALAYLRRGSELGSPPSATTRATSGLERTDENSGDASTNARS